ncbi:MAG: GFA family protein [Caulobacteraceae bacterium]
MIEATCHCGAVRIEAPRPPETVTDCNCSICRKLGALWVYYDPAEVKMTTPETNLAGYVRGDGTLTFRHCRTCGCTTDWRPLPGKSQDRMGINARLFAPEILASARIRHLDGADTWQFLD